MYIIIIDNYCIGDIGIGIQGGYGGQGPLNILYADKELMLLFEPWTIILWPPHNLGKGGYRKQSVAQTPPSEM